MAVRRLRMLTTGPAGNYSPGQILIIGAERAAALVDGGHAVYTDEGPAPDAPATKPRKGRR